MIEILESPKHLVAMRVSGELTAEDVIMANKAVDEALENNERVSMYAEFGDSARLTFQGLLRDFVEGINKWGKLNRFYRAAVVTDKGWMAAIARIEGLMFSSMDVRAFPLEDKNKALAWASDTPEPLPKPAEPEPSIKFIQTTSEDVVAFEVDGRLREADIERVVSEMRPHLERAGKMSMLARMSNYRGFDLAAVLDDDLVKLKFKALFKIEKFAVVGPKPWMRNLVELVGPLTGTEVRTFDAEEEAAAWAWVGAQQALLPE